MKLFCTTEEPLPSTSTGKSTGCFSTGCGHYRRVGDMLEWPLWTQQNSPACDRQLVAKHLCEQPPVYWRAAHLSGVYPQASTSVSLHWVLFDGHSKWPRWFRKHRGELAYSAMESLSRDVSPSQGLLQSTNSSAVAVFMDWPSIQSTNS